VDDVLIVGGGIGGLVAAISLHDAGLSVRLREAAHVVQPLGVGINLLPHAVRELDELGLLPDVLADAVTPHELVYCTKRGERIWSEPRGLEAGYRWPQVSIHRGRLQALLFDAARARDIPIDLGTRVANVDGSEARVVIGADGIHSAVRAQLHPGEGPPLWNGALLWRGLAEFEPFLDGRTMVWAGHPRQKFVTYPIGPRLVNLIAELRFDVRPLDEREDWTKPGDLADVLPAFESWDFEWLDCPGLLRATSGTYVYPMVDRDPLPRWSFGNITLLGDAAHPMYPIGSNGASQAILDARVLTGCLRSHPDDVERALTVYDDVRREATAKIVLANRGLGPEEPMAIVEERAPDGFDRLSDVITDDELAAFADRYKQVAGFAVAELNDRPSLADADY
jgi:2-polyprenyl-6-methoxyphenol hydroxylase-like FAD-dependent oxidoreductase